MPVHNHNLNIPYTLPQDVQVGLEALYAQMPHWLGYCDGAAQWYGSEGDEAFISACVEPSGLQFYAKLPDDQWQAWFTLFLSRASALLGYAVGEPEDGFDFPPSHS